MNKWVVSRRIRGVESEGEYLDENDESDIVKRKKVKRLDKI